MSNSLLTTSLASCCQVNFTVKLFPSNKFTAISVASEHCFLRTSFFPWPIKICYWICFGPASPFLLVSLWCALRLPVRHCSSQEMLILCCGLLRPGWGQQTIWLAAVLLSSNGWLKKMGKNAYFLYAIYFDFFFSAVDLVLIFYFSVWGDRERIWKNVSLNNLVVLWVGVATF